MWFRNVAIACILFLKMEFSYNQEVMATTPASELQRLRADLLKNYDRKIRPVRNLDEATKVLMYFDAQHIISLDEKDQILTVKGILMLKWTDEFLRWSPSSYSDIPLVRFRPAAIWMPDVHSLYNVKASDLYESEKGVPVTVYPDGMVQWHPPAIFDVPCSGDYRHYPFDSHNCSILFGAWTHKGEDVELETIPIPSSPTPTARGAEWLLTYSTHRTEALNPSIEYNVVRVELSLKRVSRIYRYVCTVPTFISLFSTLSGFWLLSSDTSRYLIGCSNIVLMSLLLQHLAFTLPAGGSVPLLAQYSAACLCMSSIFILVTVVTHLLKENSGSPPNGLVRLSRQYLDRYLCLSVFFQDPEHDRCLGDMSAAEGGVPTMSPEEDKRRKDWTCLSLVVDRLAFWTFVIVYAVLVGVLSSV